MFHYIPGRVLQRRGANDRYPANRALYHAKSRSYCNNVDLCFENAVPSSLLFPILSGCHLIPRFFFVYKCKVQDTIRGTAYYVNPD